MYLEDNERGKEDPKGFYIEEIRDAYIHVCMNACM
jgi:hypothetical protein